MENTIILAPPPEMQILEVEKRHLKNEYSLVFTSTVLRTALDKTIYSMLRILLAKFILESLK